MSTDKFGGIASSNYYHYAAPQSLPTMSVVPDIFNFIGGGI
ncbi:unannotated protein [freshwater metagenome]|uniref:Unannotated protein n=1 Tax=freshwater metagenome TaxID=449393 RepID=A0A6J7T9L3_9ZZZZ